jgi:hypothetical protein
MQNNSKLSKIGPILVLFIVSPIIAELLSGSTPASRSFQLIIESLYYGSGALLIREFVRRNNLGWISIFLLGIAFGIIEEGLCTQSLFNPNFMHFNLSFGRIMGVNWVWSEIIIGNHAIWSVTIPILIAELLFINRKDKPWLNGIGIGIAAVLFILGGLAFLMIFLKTSGFSTSWIHYAVAGLIVIALVVISSKIPVRPLMQHKLKTPSSIVLGIFSLIGCQVWLFLLTLVFKNDPGLPAWLVELIGVIIFLGSFYLILGWVNYKWNDLDRFSLACGALYAGMFLGLFILIGAKNNLDIYCQAGFIVIMTILFISIRNKLLKNNPAEVD